jgi:uncharacterized protein (TIGR00725 family)
MRSERRKVLSVIGSGLTVDRTTEDLCVELGKLAIDAGFRIVTGGLAGVMEAASRGARSSALWNDGDIIGILPGYNLDDANPYIDIAVPTGIGIARNVVVVSMADVVVAVGGGSGTLSELAVSWQLDKPIVALSSTEGWAAKLAGELIDDRRSDPVIEADTAAEAIDKALKIVSAP